jgi:hypothetical protein
MFYAQRFSLRLAVLALSALLMLLAAAPPVQAQDAAAAAAPPSVTVELTSTGDAGTTTICVSKSPTCPPTQRSTMPRCA